MTIRALVVDDSAICRAVLRDLLEEEGDISVVGEAGNGYEALAMVEELHPNVVTMDLDMPGADGLETVAAIMSRQPVPILVVTGRTQGADADLVFLAIERGALDLLPKLAFTQPQTRAWIRAQVRTCAGTPVFLQKPVSVETIRPPPQVSKVTVHAPPLSKRVRIPARLAVLVAGTGGAMSVAEVLAGLPRDLPCAVAVAQHGRMQFASAYAAFLGKKTLLPVTVVGRIPAQCAPGQVFVPADGCHLVCLADGMLAAIPDSDLEVERVRVETLFRSLAETFRAAVAVVILSGLEAGGEDGLAILHDMGAPTIAEDPARARRPEMPRAAAEHGDVDRVLSIGEIAGAIVEACRP